MGKPKRAMKPAFIRQESWRYKRLKGSWRKPKGKSSRMRRSIQGAPPLVKIGYGRPRRYRTLHPSGYREVLIHNPEELMTLNPEREAARIAATVGEKKRFAIMSKAEELHIKVLNPPRVEEAEAMEAPTEPEGTPAAETQGEEKTS